MQGKTVYLTPLPTDPDIICRDLLGMSVDTLVDTIIKNKDGEYDFLYCDGIEKQTQGSQKGESA